MKSRFLGTPRSIRDLSDLKLGLAPSLMSLTIAHRNTLPDFQFEANHIALTMQNVVCNSGLKNQVKLYFIGFDVVANTILNHTFLATSGCNP